MMMNPEAASILEENALLRVALATSQADVTRLTAELAESVRALAVSQGETTTLLDEVMALRRVLDDIEFYDTDWAVGTGENVARLQHMACVGLNRPIPSTPLAIPGTAPGGARGICGCAKRWDEPSLGELDRITPATVCPDCHHPGPHDRPCDYYASPEPDRASPEVTVKENDR